jgi:2-polyprenyl-3-methyl-5-hydroxy-6-metoxy-1,4-benzoquinol methylase
MTQYHNPFEGLTQDQIYGKLRSPSSAPQWPDVGMQLKYTNWKGPTLIGRTMAFIDILERDGAFRPNWKGLDYGCGWGRIASLCLSKGSAAQLDMVDAWTKSLSDVGTLKFPNRIWQVSEILQSGDLPADTYDFVYSFSVFTHLARKPFEENLLMLSKALKKNGNIYITVRREEFARHHYPEERARAIVEQLKRNDGFWFESSTTGLGDESSWGHAIVTEDYLKGLGLGKVDYLGKPHDLRHVFVLRKG